MTLGNDRVRTTFNPSKDNAVDEIKHKTAELIDICEELKLVAQKIGPPQSETIRLLVLAQTAYEEAAMWAVKAATSGK
jgi:hypothetical protein